MRRIEGAAEQADGLASCGPRRVSLDAAEASGGGRGHGFSKREVTVVVAQF
jgi:hypothetical protein